jgi:hypothetical protein
MELHTIGIDLGKTVVCRQNPIRVDVISEVRALFLI